MCINVWISLVESEMLYLIPTEALRENINHWNPTRIVHSAIGEYYARYRKHGSNEYIEKSGRGYLFFTQKPMRHSADLKQNY